MLTFVTRDVVPIRNNAVRGADVSHGKEVFVGLFDREGAT